MQNAHSLSGALSRSINTLPVVCSYFCKHYIQELKSVLNPASMVSRGLSIDVSPRTHKSKAKKKAEICPSPIGNMIAALEARILHSPGGTSPGKPISPGLVNRVNKVSQMTRSQSLTALLFQVLADGGEDLGEFDAGDFQSLSWLLRMGDPRPFQRERQI